MKLHRSFVSLVIAVIVLILISQSVSIVSQGQTGVRLRGGTVVSAGLAPGLHFRVPFVGHIAGLDSQWITLNSAQQNGGRVKLATSDGKTLKAGYTAVWRITDPALFCRETGCDESTGARRVNDRIAPALRQIFATHKAAELTSGKSDELLAGLPAEINSDLGKFGVSLQAIHLTALALPDDVAKNVYKRMRSAQSDQASKASAGGAANADKIRAEAEQQRADLLAKASVQAQTIRGQAQADAATIYARAYHKNPGFYRFYRSLQAYQRTIKKGNSVIVLGPDSGFLKYFDGLKRAGTPRR